MDNNFFTLYFSPEEAREKAKMMIGSHLVTKQTTSEGRLCQEVLVCKRMFTRREYYFSIMLDRAHNVCCYKWMIVWYCLLQGPILIGSSRGGVNIEEVAQTDPTAITTMPVDFDIGLTRAMVIELAKKMGIHELCIDKAADMITKLYDLFLKCDCTLIEINPLAEDVNGNGEPI